MNAKVKKMILLIGIFGIGSLFGWSSSIISNDKRNASALNSIHPIREEDDGYQFINPLLSYAVPEAPTFGAYTHLDQELNNFIEGQRNQGTQISVYFRDLIRGQWVGAHETDSFTPGSLLKVPILIHYLKVAETNPGILNQEISYQNMEIRLDETIKPRMTIIPNKKYTVSELLDYMIRYSDNNATVALYKNIDGNALYEIFTDLDIVLPKGVQDFISPQSYSLFFRSLYNSTYLNRTSSEKALRLLSEVDYAQGLVGGLPPGIVVSHKFGETAIANIANSKQLHDCGIIYAPKQPYFLCVMTHGANYDQLASAIRTVSQIVYRNATALK